MYIWWHDTNKSDRWCRCHDVIWLILPVSTENATSPKPTKSRNPDFLVSRGSNSNSDFDLTWMCTEEFEFLDLVDFGGIACSVESVIRVAPSSHVTYLISSCLAYVCVVTLCKLVRYEVMSDRIWYEWHICCEDVLWLTMRQDAVWLVDMGYEFFICGRTHVYVTWHLFICDGICYDWQCDRMQYDWFAGVMNSSFAAGLICMWHDTLVHMRQHAIWLGCKRYNVLICDRTHLYVTWPAYSYVTGCNMTTVRVIWQIYVRQDSFIYDMTSSSIWGRT